MKYVQLIFSPTGGTEKAAEAITLEWSASVETVDLTDRSVDFSKYKVEADDIVLIALPSYGGRVPALAAERLSQIRGNHAKCVLLCVYGNRAYEDTLVEMEDLAQGCGFNTVAAIAAVAEHSIMRQFASGRPDGEDTQQLKAFARSILEKIKTGDPNDKLKIPGNRPYKKSGNIPLVPKADKKCNGCGICMESCPTGAIPKEDLKTADAKKCIACMRCVTKCPRSARKVNGAMVTAASLAIKKACSVRKDAELYL